MISLSLCPSMLKLFQYVNHCQYKRTVVKKCFVAVLFLWGLLQALFCENLLEVKVCLIFRKESVLFA